MFLCFSIILSVFFDTATCITAPSVKTYYLALNEDHCLITDKRMHARNILNGTSKTHFLIDRAVPCLPDMTNAFDLTVPEHMKVNFVVQHNLKERLCNVEQSTVFYYKCYFNFNFQGGNEETTQATTVQTEKVTQMSTVISSTIEPTTVETTTETTTIETTIKTTENTTESVTNTTESTVNTRSSKSNLYVYVGGGVVIFLLIVIQATCIILYKRKVAKSRRTLNYVLTSRVKEMSEKKVRYSVGPVKKHAVKTTPPNTEEENVYESMERIAETAPRAKSTPSPVISPRNETINRSLRARPKLPLPHELQALEYEDMRGNRGPQTSTGITLPPGIQSPLMEDMRGNRGPQTSTGLTLPLGIQSPLMEDMRGNRGPQTSTGLTLPPGIQSPLMEAKTPPQNTSFQSTDRFPQPPASIARPRPYTPMSNISKIHTEKLRTIHEESKRSFDSSDEEWTYEQLPPMEKYLHSN